MDTVDVQHEWIDPITGECVDRDDPDALLAAYERVKRFEAVLGVFKQELAWAITRRSPPDGGPTRWLHGRDRRARVQMPADVWDQRQLRELWHAYPRFSESVLRIRTLRVRLRAWRKQAQQRGSPDFETFKAMLQAANLGPRGTPRIILDER
jgi:hypothetical protein